MQKKLLAILPIFLLVGMVMGVVVKEYVVPTTGEISSVSLSITWLNGTEVNTMDWGPTENNTEYVMEPINITNLSNIPVNLTLFPINEVNITALTLTWNYTGAPLNPQDSVIVELYQTCTATGPYSYDTVITATETQS